MFCRNGIPEKRKSVIELVVLFTFHNWVIPQKKSKKAKITCICLYNTFVNFVYQTVYLTRK